MFVTQASLTCKNLFAISEWANSEKVCGYITQSRRQSSSPPDRVGPPAQASNVELTHDSRETTMGK